LPEYYDKQLGLTERIRKAMVALMLIVFVGGDMPFLSRKRLCEDGQSRTVITGMSNCWLLLLLRGNKSMWSPAPGA
jgi:hypothetical protein